MISNNGIVQRYLIFEKIRAVSAFFWKESAAIKSYSGLRDINKELSIQNTALLAEKEKYKNILNQLQGEAFARTFTDSLKMDSLLVKSGKTFDYQWAQVIKNTLNTTHNYLILDKGEEDGITEDMGVITPAGVIGITRAVGKKYTYVYSFLNSNQQVSAKVGHTNAFGPLTWDQTSLESATLTEIPQHIDVKQGDTIYTSGYSSFFPPDIPLGTAQESNVINGTHLSIKVKLLQDFKNVNYVIIIKNNSNTEIDSLVNVVNPKP
ncbi:MAG: rod shape-determining protein MreC [Bacteroidales bacterium]